MFSAPLEGFVVAIGGCTQGCDNARVGLPWAVAARPFRAVLRGADVRVVHGGVAAIEAVEEQRADVVLLDIGMPEMDGYEVARRIRERHEFGDVTLIALTEWRQEDDRRRTHEAGFDHHLVKPADIAALKSLLVPLQ